MHDYTHGLVHLMHVFLHYVASLFLLKMLKVEVEVEVENLTSRLTIAMVIMMMISMMLILIRYEEPLLYGSFPEGFLWGTATAAYQVKLCRI